MKGILGVVALGVLLLGLYVAGAWFHLYGDLEHAGEPTDARVPVDVVKQRVRGQQRAAASLSAAPTKQILFGDLHVHTTFSTDAFLWSLPMMNGQGAHPVADACDYARFCSSLDFWSINDHAEASTPRKWSETRESIRQCNAAAGDPSDPDVAAFLGWEWSQVGQTPEDHYGHKNVIFRELEDDKVPARPIGAAGIATDGLRGSVGGMPPLTGLVDFPNRDRYFDFIQFMDEVRDIPSCPEGVSSTELPDDCYESARTPADLFEKLSQLGHETMVIPHGNTWGFYSPPGITWDKQLAGPMHDPELQVLVEVMSGHGNSEEYRDWRAVRFDDAGEAYCPEPSDGYLPSCWQAGVMVEQRCLEDGGEAAACAARGDDARARSVLMGAAGNLMLPEADFTEWLDAGQCTDCFLPSFNYRPGGSSQYALAISNFDQAEPRRFRFGFIASSDNHSARPGTGYKEFDRKNTTEANGLRDESWRSRVNRPREDFDPWVDISDQDAVREAVLEMGFVALEAERQASFFTTGGLVAVHSDGRGRDEIWDTMERREVYGTSGDRILLWFTLLNADRPDGSFGAVPMGSDVAMKTPPRFEVRAVGAFEQKEGCPDFATGALEPEHLEHLCKGECYNPSDQRKLITKIEVIRIRPQSRPGERVAPLIEDPWRSFDCPGSPSGCVVQFEDPEFAAGGRDTVYYARALQEPTPVVNGDALRCERDEAGKCIEANPCFGDYRTDSADDCLTDVSERAWSSPIFVDYDRG